jgi:hypothetical protein
MIIIIISCVAYVLISVLVFGFCCGRMAIEHNCAPKDFYDDIAPIAAAIVWPFYLLGIVGLSYFLKYFLSIGEKTALKIGESQKLRIQLQEKIRVEQETIQKEIEQELQLNFDDTNPSTPSPCKRM